MFRNDFKSINQVFSDSHKLITRGTLFFGAFAVILAGLVFLFPAFIGTLVAMFILLAGLVALLAGYRFWKAGRKKIGDLGPYNPELSEIYSQRPRNYHYRTIRFIRW